MATRVIREHLAQRKILNSTVDEYFKRQKVEKRSSIRWCSLQKFTEFKHTYWNETKTFDCYLVERMQNEVVLAFRPSEEIQFLGITFGPNTVSLGYFWENRNYNVYHWKDVSGNTLLFYFNISKDTKFGADRVDWKDLIVDIAVKPHSKPAVLDEQEVPQNAQSEDIKLVQKSEEEILSKLEIIQAYLEAKSNHILTQRRNEIFGA